MEHLHSAWGFLFILGLFAVELGYNVLGSACRGSQTRLVDGEKLAIYPIAMHRRPRESKVS